MAAFYGTFAISCSSIEPGLWPFESLTPTSRGVAIDLHVTIPNLAVL
jgi:hypothetical protein